MAIAWLILAVLFAVPLEVTAQSAADPAEVDYIYLRDGGRVPLTRVPDAAFYRIHADAEIARTASVRDPLNRVMSVSDVHNGPAQLAVRRSAETAAAARAAIKGLTDIKEADQLRVFTIGGDLEDGSRRTLLVEYPEIILQCDETVTLDQVQRYLRQHYQATAVPTGLHAGQFLVSVVTPHHTLWLANQLKSTKDLPVVYADVNFFFAHPSGMSPPKSPSSWPTAGPNPPVADPGFADQWALENRGAQPGAVQGADIGFTRALRKAPLDATGIRIAVLDYAIDVGHPELTGAVYSKFNAARFDPNRGRNDPALRTLDFAAAADHGTACAGIIAARSNGFGITGVAPNVQIVAIQIARPLTQDLDLANPLTMLAALDEARLAGAQVVSLSWGLRLTSGLAFDSIRAAIKALNLARDGKGIVVVSAAGNDSFGIFDPDFPADYSSAAPNLIPAGASNWCGSRKTTTTCDKESWNSRYNADTLFAPGVDILTITNAFDLGKPNELKNYRSNFNGTSAATPFVAAAAALVLKQNPTWTAAQVRTHLMKTAATLKGGNQQQPQMVLDICNALHGANKC